MNGDTKVVDALQNLTLTQFNQMGIFVAFMIVGFFVIMAIICGVGLLILKWTDK